jgi:hypothetical protein
MDGYAELQAHSGIEPGPQAPVLNGPHWRAIPAQTVTKMDADKHQGAEKAERRRGKVVGNHQMVNPDGSPNSAFPLRSLRLCVYLSFLLHGYG